MRNTFLGITSLLFIILVFLRFNRPSVEGQWVGEYVIEGLKDTLQIDAQIIHLNLSGDTYTFESTLNHSEAGSYQHIQGALIIRPENQPSYKMVIKELEDDHLQLSMTEGSTSRLLSLKRSN